MELDKATLYRAEKLDNLLVFQANYLKFQFSRHAHEDFALGLMEGGIQRFYCRGEDCRAPLGSLITVNAGEVHDGMSADGRAYRYRIIYIPGALMKEIGADMVVSGESPYFRRPVTEDPELAGRLGSVFRLLDEEHIDFLEVQSLFYTLLTTLLARHGTTTHCGSCKIVPEAVDRACAFINDMAGRNITLDDIASAAGLSRYHFLRIFNASTGMTPHSYLLQRRLQLAKVLLKKGSTIADAALDACFADQSHFSRKFKAAFGITPNQYKKAVC